MANPPARVQLVMTVTTMCVLRWFSGVLFGGRERGDAREMLGSGICRGAACGAAMRWSTFIVARAGESCAIFVWLPTMTSSVVVVQGEEEEDDGDAPAGGDEEEEEEEEDGDEDVRGGCRRTRGGWAEEQRGDGGGTMPSVRGMLGPILI